MSLISGKYWTGDPKIKPDAWGPFEDVQAALHENMDSIFNINPSKIKLYMPFWGPGTQYDYSYNNIVGMNNAATFDRDGLIIGSHVQPVALSKTISFPDTEDFLIFADVFFSTGTFVFLCGANDADNYLGLASGIFRLQDNRSSNLDTVFAPASYTNYKIAWKHYGALHTVYPNDYDLYINGSSHNGIYSSAQVCNPRFLIDTIGNGYNVASYNWKGKIRSILIISGVDVSSDQISLLSEYSYGLLQPITRRSYFIPDASGLSSIIRSASWRIKETTNSNSEWKLLSRNLIQSSWTCSNRISKDVDWSIATSSDLSSSWTISHKVELNSAWEISNTNQLESKWKVLKKATVSSSWALISIPRLSLSWDVINAISSDSDWVVKNAKGLDCRWNIKSSIQLQTSWGIYDKIAISLNSGWKVITSEVVESTWTVKKDKQINSSWKVKVKSSIGVEYLITSSLSMELEYRIRNNVRIITRWGIGEFTEDSGLFLYKQFDDFIYKEIVNYLTM